MSLVMMDSVGFFGCYQNLYISVVPFSGPARQLRSSELPGSDVPIFSAGCTICIHSDTLQPKIAIKKTFQCSTNSSYILHLRRSKYVVVVVRILTVHHLLSKFIMKIAPTNKLLEGQVPNYTLYLGTYTNSASVTNICVNYMLCMMIQGPSINDITHLGGRGIGQKLTYLHISLFSKMGDKGKGGVKNFKKWVTSFIDGPYQILFSSEKLKNHIKLHIFSSL